VVARAPQKDRSDETAWDWDIAGFDKNERYDRLTLEQLRNPQASARPFSVTSHLGLSRV